MKLSSFIYFIAFCTLLLVSVSSTAQVDSIHGLITIKASHTYGWPVTVVNRTTGDFTISEYNGRFSIAGSLGDLYSFKANGLKQVDTVINQPNPMITMTFMEPPRVDTSQKEVTTYKPGVHFSYFNISLAGFNRDYNEYRNLLDSTSVSMLSNLIGTPELGFHWRYKQFEFGGGIGFNSSLSDGFESEDSLDRRLHMTQLNLSISTPFLSQTRLSVRPRLDLRYYRSRLIIKSANPQSISNYLDTRHIDLRLHQVYVIPTLNIYYRLFKPEEGYLYDSFINAIGLSGGVVFPINSYPYAKSLDVRINDIPKVRTGQYFLELTVAHLF